ncbi:hypothetical protein G9P44_001087 [Scheffersomyces stipitis]|nr:hypothetical protein G9P44_001087 [Scheffersomyces stipitis]
MFKGVFPRSRERENSFGFPRVGAGISSAPSSSSSEGNSSEEMILSGDVPKLKKSRSFCIPIEPHNLEKLANESAQDVNESFDPFSPSRLERSKSMTFSLERKSSFGVLSRPKSVTFSLLEEERVDDEQEVSNGFLEEAGGVREEMVTKERLFSPREDEADDEKSNTNTNSDIPTPNLHSEYDGPGNYGESNEFNCSSEYSSPLEEKQEPEVKFETIRDYRSYENDIQSLFSKELTGSEPDFSEPLEEPHTITKNSEVQTAEEEDEVFHSLKALAALTGIEDIALKYANNYELSSIIFSLAKSIESKIRDTTSKLESRNAEYLELENQHEIEMTQQVEEFEQLKNEKNLLNVEYETFKQNTVLEKEEETEKWNRYYKHQNELREIVNEKVEALKTISLSGYEVSTYGNLVEAVKAVVESESSLKEEVSLFKGIQEEKEKQENEDKKELQSTKDALNSVIFGLDSAIAEKEQLQYKFDELKAQVSRNNLNESEKNEEHAEDEKLVSLQYKQALSPNEMAAKINSATIKSLSTQQEHQIHTLNKLLEETEHNIKDALEKTTSNLSEYPGMLKHKEQEIIDLKELLILHERSESQLNESLRNWKNDHQNLMKQVEKLTAKVDLSKKQKDAASVTINSLKESLAQMVSEKIELSKLNSILQQYNNDLVKCSLQTYKGCYEGLSPLLYEESRTYYLRLYEFIESKKENIPAIEKMSRFFIRSIQDLADQFRANEELLEKEIQGKQAGFKDIFTGITVSAQSNNSF